MFNFKLDVRMLSVEGKENFLGFLFGDSQNARVVHVSFVEGELEIRKEGIGFQCVKEEDGEEAGNTITHWESRNLPEDKVVEGEKSVVKNLMEQ